MKRSLAALLLAFSSACFAADDFPLAPAVECIPRAGLPNFLAKLKTKDADVHYPGAILVAGEMLPNP
jgi:hypothetical protein